MLEYELMRNWTARRLLSRRAGHREGPPWLPFSCCPGIGDNRCSRAVFTASSRMHTLASSHAAWQRARVWAELMMYRLGFHACVLQATPLSICLYDGHPQTPMLPICQFLLLIMNSDWRIKPRVSSDLSKRKKTTQLFLTDGTTLHFYLGIAIVCSSIICATHTRYFSSTSVYTMCDFHNDT